QHCRRHAPGAAPPLPHERGRAGHLALQRVHRIVDRRVRCEEVRRRTVLRDRDRVRAVATRMAELIDVVIRRNRVRLIEEAFGRRALHALLPADDVAVLIDVLHPGPGPGPGPAPGTRVLPDTLDVATLVDAVVDHMPRRNTNGYAPPSPDQRIAMVAILAEARAGRVARADSLADRYDYDVEATVDALHGDTLLVMIERTPIERGWGTYIIRKGAAPADVHVNHPLFDVNTPDVAVALYNACRCRALLIAGTHRYANGGDESDMARATGSVFQ